jgi:flagellar motor switch protein FliM
VEALPSLSSFLEKALSVDFCSAMAEAFRMPLEIRFHGVEECSLADFLSSVEERSCCVALVAGAPVAPESADVPTAGDLQPAWLEVSPQIAFPIIDRLMGGTGRDWYVPNRPLTAIERRLIQRVGDSAAASLGGANPATPSGAEAPPWRCDAERKLPGNSIPSPAVVLAKFTLSMGRQAGAIRLCLPKELVGKLGTDPTFGGRKWGLSLVSPPADQQGRTGGPLELSVVVQDIAISQKELSGIAEGDILMTDMRADGEVLVRIGGIPRFYARLGVSNGRKAIRITRRIDEPGK